MFISIWDRNKKDSGSATEKNLLKGKYVFRFDHIYYFPTFAVPKDYKILNKEFKLYKYDYFPDQNHVDLYIDIIKNPVPIALVLGVIGLGIFTFFTLTKIERVITLPGFLIPVGVYAYSVIRK